MTDDDTARLRALASAASIGPWSVHGNNCDEWYVYALHARYETLPGNPSPVKVAWVPWSPGTLRHEHDAAYIAAASPDVVLRLLDALDEARRERDDLGAKLVDAINLAAERTRERDELRALLAEARGYVQQEAEHGGYGFARPDNPHDFFPDQESCSPEEIANHKAACEAWGRGEYTPEAASGWISEDVHVTRAPWGIGSYTFRDPQATSLIARIDAALAEEKR